MIVYIKRHDSKASPNSYYLYTEKNFISYSDSVQLIYIKNKSIIPYMINTGIALYTLEEILK